MAGESDRRIRQLIGQANQDFASGRVQDAARYLNQAMAEAPRHPLVLGELAKRKLLAGEANEAYALLRQATAAEPEEPSLWLSLAMAARALRRLDEEMAALDKALTIEPRNLQALLQAAAAHGEKGDTRTSAAVYRTALQSLPSNANLPREMGAVIQSAKSVIDRNNTALEIFLEDRLSALRARFANQSLDRFDHCLQTLLLRRKVYRPQPSFMYFPHLPAIEFFDRDLFPWLDGIETATADIRAELVQVLAEDQGAVTPYMALSAQVHDHWRELNNSRRWGAYFFWREGVAYPRNQARCPKTMAALKAWPKCEMPGCAPTAMFSILEPRTRIPPHMGVNNCRLVVHVPLVIPPGCGFRVGPETRPWEPGKAFVFDDTIEHEAWNNSDETRAVLILDVWNPYLTDAEREMVCAAIEGIDAFYGDLPGYVRPLQKEG
jgi:aspartyl/asparaginyl beta-hydroxylase (cupin superfamily)